MKISFRKNFTWNFFGNILYAATQWGTLIAITRLGNVEMVGVYSLALALTAPIIMFTNLDLRTVQATETDGILRFSDFFTVRLISNIFFLVMLTILLIVGEYEKFYVFAIALVALAKIIESWSDAVYGNLQKHERMDIISKSQIIRGIISLLAFVITLLLTENLLLALLINAICWLLVFLIYDIRALRKIEKIKLSYSTKIIQIIKLSLPLGIVALIVSLNTNIPKIVIEKYLDIEMLGYFTTIFYFVMIGEKVVRSLSQVALPRLSRLTFDKNRSKFIKLLFKILILSFLIGIIGIMIAVSFGEQILVLVYGSDYKNYSYLLTIIMSYGLVNYLNSTLLTGVNALRLFSIQKYLSIFWLVVMITVCIILISYYGLLGAGLAVLIYGLVRFLTISLLLIYGLKVKFN